MTRAAAWSATARARRCALVDDVADHTDDRTRADVGLLVSMTMIDKRPATVADRREVGHWEGDYIMGTGNRSAIGTLVERTTGKVVLVHLGHDRSAVALGDALIEVFDAMPASVRPSLTQDQGKELAGHLELTRVTGIPRGHTSERLAAVAHNARPRKTLGWATPADLFDRHRALTLVARTG